MPVPVRVAAPALGPVAGTVASEQRVGVSPDVVGRQFGLETADVPERVVLAAEHHYVGTALAQGLTEHVHKKVHQLAAPPVERPLTQNAQPSARDLAVVERRVPLVVMQEHPALRVVIEQPLDKPAALGRPQVCRNAVGDGHGAFRRTADQRAAPSASSGRAGQVWSARLLFGSEPSGTLEAILIDPTETTAIPGIATPLEASGVSVPGPVPATSEADQKPPGLRGVARGFSWGTAGQLIGVAGNLVLTPFIIHGLGVQRYGIFVLVVTLTGMLNSFDGGAMGAAQRYFSIYAGTDDRRSTTQLLVTFCVLLTVVGIVISTAAWFLSPVVVGFLNMSAIWRPQAIFLFRTLGLLVTTLFIHTLFQLVLNSRQRYAYTSAASLANYAFYVVGFVIVIETGRGLRGVAFIFVGQQVLASALIIPVAVRYLDRRGVSFVPWSKLRSIMSFSGKMQVGGIAALVVTEVDSLIIGGALSVRALGIYSPGANFANQLSSVAANGLGPRPFTLATSTGARAKKARSVSSDGSRGCGSSRSRAGP